MTTEKRASLVGRGLAGELRFLRKDRRMTCQVVADLLGWQASKMSRMETGQQGITVADLASLLTIYHVIGAERERLLRMIDRQDEPGQWEIYPVLSEGSKTLVRLEPDASAIVTVQPLLIPGLVQTADYCRALMESCNVPPGLTDLKVNGRLARQEILANAMSFDMIVDEMAFRRVLGSHKIMARQLRAVLAAVERPNVTLRVLPFVLGGHEGLDGPFLVMDFPRNKPVVYLEHKLSGVFLEEPDQVDFYRSAATTLMEVALSPAESAEFVATIAREHEQK